MRDIEIQLKHSNNCHIALERIKSITPKKAITKEEKEKYKAFFEGETGILIIEKLTRDIIEHCKLPESIELRKKLEYNHDDIMIREETSIAKKILLLIKNLITENRIFGLKMIIFFIEVDEGNHENYDSDDQKEREDMFKKHNFKIFRCNPNDPNFDLFKFLGEINLYVSKLREKNAVNRVINKITDDFEKIVAVTKLKE